MSRPKADRAPPPSDLSAGAYRLISIVRTRMPSGGVGGNWVVYRIAQGPNVITGYRRGSMPSVEEDVKKVVDALNERRLARRGRVDLTPAPSSQHAAASAARKGSS